MKLPPMSKTKVTYLRKIHTNILQIDKTKKKFKYKVNAQAKYA